MESSIITIVLVTWVLLQQSQATPDTLFCVDREDGLFPDPVDCASWYSCSEDVTSHHTCEYGLMYSYASGLCEQNPVCNIVCPRLYLSHGTVETTGYKPFDTAKHVCDKGYNLIDGGEVRTCGSDGVWTGNTRRCWPGPEPMITDQFSQYPGFRYSHKILHDLTNVQSGEHCAEMCRSLPTCKSANYQRHTLSCNLMDRVPAFLPDHLDTHDDFEYIELK